MLQREPKWLVRGIEAHDVQSGRQMAARMNGRQRIRGRAEANIPNHERPRFLAHTFGNPELLHVKRLRLGDGAMSGMHRLGIGGRVDGPIAVL